MMGVEDIFLWMLVLMRVVGMMLIVPFFSHSSVPAMARIGFGSAFAIMIFPLVSFDAAYPESAFALTLWMAKELAVGLCMGLAMRMVFFVVSFASHILTLQIGLMPSPEFNPSAASGFNPFGSIMYFLCVVMLLSGSEYDMLATFVLSYEVAPLGFTQFREGAVEEIVVASMGIFKTGILIAAPVIAVNFLVNLVFAVLGKLVPRLNVFILSFAARILAGTAVLAFSSVLIAHYIMRYLDETPEMMMRFIMFRPLF